MEKIRAFTLAEMLIVLVIAAIVMAMSAPLITKKSKKPVEMSGGGSSVPIGTIMIWGGETSVPRGWLECDGREIKENKYNRLRAVLGGAENVPDMSGVVLIGFSTKTALNQVKSSNNSSNNSYNNSSNNNYEQRPTNKYGPKGGGYSSRHNDESDDDRYAGFGGSNPEAQAALNTMGSESGIQPTAAQVTWIIRAEP